MSSTPNRVPPPPLLPPPPSSTTRILPNLPPPPLPARINGASLSNGTDVKSNLLPSQRVGGGSTVNWSPGSALRTDIEEEQHTYRYTDRTIPSPAPVTTLLPPVTEPVEVVTKPRLLV